MNITTINDFDVHYKFIENKEIPHIYPKSLVCLSVKYCDVCKKTDCCNKDNGVNIVSIALNYGIQLCDVCVSKYSMDTYKYFISLIKLEIPNNYFKLIIKSINPDFDFNNITIKRTNGDFEIWKLHGYSPITFKNDSFNIPVNSQDEKIGKTVPLKQLCELNKLQYADIKDIFEEKFLQRQIKKTEKTEKTEKDLVYMSLDQPD